MKPSIGPISSQEAVQLEDQYGALNYHPLPVVLAKGEGCFLYSPEGVRYYDFLAGYGAVNQGHCHPRMVKAITEQAALLTLTSRAFYSNLLGPAEKKICESFGYQRVLLMNSGAEANETAIKLARRWGYDVKKIPTNQAKIICATENFHGRTTGMISASSDPDSKGGFGPYLPGFISVPYGQISAIESELKDSTIAAVWIEPIQGEAGVKIPPAGYLKQVAEACKKHGVLLIMDEIQTGIGRAGYRLAADAEGVRPDIVVLGKSLAGGMMPVSAVLADDSVMLVIKPGQHGSTFGGNPLAARLVIEALSIVEDEKLYNNSLQQGTLFRKALTDAIGKHPFVKEIRGQGLMSAIELFPKTAVSGWDLCLKMRDLGLLAKPTHGTVIRLSPPLIITSKQIQEAVQIIAQAFNSSFDSASQSNA